MNSDRSSLRSTLIRVGRWACALVFAAIVAGGAWLAILEEGHGGHILGTTWTSHDFPEGLGNALGATDNLSRWGMWATWVIALVIVVLFVLLERFLPGREWLKGLSFAPIILLLWGLVFCPLVDAKQILTEDGEFHYLPSGLFGINSSKGTILSAIVASAVAGLTIARIVQLVRSEEWWEPHKADREFVVDRGAGTLLELPKEGPEHGSERPG